MDLTKVPSPCYVMEEDLLRKNLSLIKSVADRAGVEIILAFKAFAMILLPVRNMKPDWLLRSSEARHTLIRLHIRKRIFLHS